MQRSFCLRSFAFAVLCWIVPQAFADAPQMRLWLKNGSYMKGHFVDGASQGFVGFQSDLFREPVHFDIRAVRSVAGNTLSDDQLSGHFFLIDGGTRIAGDLKSWDEETVVIQSPTLGEVKLERSKLRLIEAAEDGGKRIYTGPRSLDDWEILDDPANWEFAAGSLTALNKQSRAVGDVDLPERFRLNLSMSWEGRADFVLSLGATKPKKKPPVNNNVNRRGVAPAATQQNAAVRLEMWDAQLAVVREIGNLADIAVLPLDDSASRFELTIYVDQSAGLVAVYSTRGRLLEKIQVAEEKGESREFAMLENHGRKVSLDTFDVFSWDGHLPNSTEYPEGYVLDTAENVTRGEIVGFDSEKSLVRMVDQEGQASELPMSKLRRVVISKPKADEGNSGDLEETPESEQGESEQPEEETDSEDDKAVDEDGAGQGSGESAAGSDAGQDPLDPESLIEVEFQDSSRLIGYLTQSDKGKFEFFARGVREPLYCGADQVVSMIGSESGFDAPKLEGVQGTLETEDTKLVGSLQENPKPNGDAVMLWKPWSAKSAVAISRSANGRIQYRKTRARVAAAPQQAARARAVQQQAGIGQFLGGIFGGPGADGANRQANKPKPAATKSGLDQYEIVFQSGDAINGAVLKIDDKGIHIESDETTTKFVPHDQLESVALSRSVSVMRFSEEKLARLRTIPRSMKNDPPTHLFLAKNGDYLRGRLVSMDGKAAQVEVRLAVKEIPRTMISKVIWLHDRPWMEKKEGGKEDPEQAEPDDDRPFLVHAVRATKRGVTFEPRRLEGGRLAGDSELLGECNVDLAGINTLLFGTDVGKEALALRKSSWTLALAQLPKVFQESEDDGDGTLGIPSALVGRKAPAIDLQTIDGKAFSLKDLQGKVVVLDFWASWCGPCIAMMPELEKVVEEFDENDIQLVTVNQQDSVDRAKIALKRMGINPMVIMDVDAEAAAFYDVKGIPQTVVIDREGEITHVFVGGGEKNLKQIRAAISQTIDGASL